MIGATTLRSAVFLAHQVPMRVAVCKAWMAIGLLGDSKQEPRLTFAAKYYTRVFVFAQTETKTPVPLEPVRTYTARGSDHRLAQHCFSQLARLDKAGTSGEPGGFALDPLC